MTTIEKARAAAQKAAQELAAAEHAEAQKAAQKTAERAEAQRKLDAELWENWREIDAGLQHDKVTDAELAEAFKDGSLAELAADHSSRRIARNSVRTAVQGAADRLGHNSATVPDLRNYETATPHAVYEDYLRRAINFAASQRAMELSDPIVEKYEVSIG